MVNHKNTCDYTIEGTYAVDDLNAQQWSFQESKIFLTKKIANYVHFGLKSANKPKFSGVFGQFLVENEQNLKFFVSVTIINLLVYHFYLMIWLSVFLHTQTVVIPYYIAFSLKLI